jgi:hypothetical protein
MLPRPQVLEGEGIEDVYIMTNSVCPSHHSLTMQAEKVSEVLDV